ncbi:peptidase M23 [Flavonifractor sp. An92]|uniref:M23 family metallopeptidase n=1 Tax=Flavonifractor sp. An92 TaxID=1965666 RepID=UPI000B3AA3B6|nr:MULTISPECIES: M23 family metallopeptidase [unclassified Flavonifractor]OUN01989.1 peptidase M23 [Flavonifractor sp. An92]OUQ17458.1 peptidase M23 [Flavonifractor sp. An135]
MEGMTYQDWTRRRGERTTSRPRSSSRKKGAKVELAPREKRRLLQLLVCTLLFAVVLVGKGVFPQRLNEARETLGAILHADTDFTAAFLSLGQSLEAGEPMGETLETLWSGVFAPEEGAELSASDHAGGGALTEAVAACLARGEAKGAEELLEGNWSQPQETGADPFAGTGAPALPEEEAEPAVVHVDYDGPALPANTTMDQYALGLSETVSPVVGWVSSPFGWREHPVYGEEKFHNGVDLAVNTGTPIGAFAAGTVEYIGDSPDEYGLYLQIDHGNGVKSFYAHCSQLCVQQGQTVAAGETVALAGETGNATGPHLHFEVKFQGVRLNPVYYIETN